MRRWRNGGPFGLSGIGTIAARRLMDQCEVDRCARGARDTTAKILSRAPFVTGKTLEKVIKQLKHEPQNPSKRSDNKTWNCSETELHERQG